ncbi:carbonic anhydrase 14 isoform X3 [Denticeps clupeoides]|uniref:carbonic anhydrase 14 isoform X3 n=1 Tax=Denticeps clupeoides TaxID=299321 RepID=UPI0010A538B5|nr:carbonic anhydrase 14 isoform X3 [Denticeps clupeoides]
MDYFLMSVFLLLLLWQCASCKVAEKPWTYSGHVGQSEWLELFPDCGGSDQSPIDIDSTQTKYEPKLPPVRPLGYNQHGHEPFTLFNNGHTVEIPLPSWMGVAGLPWQCSAVQLHLHWGNPMGVATGSEHTINGRSAAAESGEETNQGYANIINYLGRIKHAGQKVAIPAFDIRALLPKDLGRYFRYNGSLTTPPCYQSVLWTVFQETVMISETQLMKLETVLYSSTTEESERTALQDNYRTTQPLNQRTVLASFRKDSKVFSAGEISAIVVGSLCGCVGLALIIRFIVKTIRWVIFTSPLRYNLKITFLLATVLLPKHFPAIIVIIISESCLIELLSATDVIDDGYNIEYSDFMLIMFLVT